MEGSVTRRSGVGYRFTAVAVFLGACQYRPCGAVSQQSPVTVGSPPLPSSIAAFGVDDDSAVDVAAFSVSATGEVEQYQKPLMRRQNINASGSLADMGSYALFGAPPNVKGVKIPGNKKGAQPEEEVCFPQGVDADGVPIPETCCDPAIMKDPFFSECLGSQCRYAEPTPSICWQRDLCTKECHNNCCCFFRVLWTFFEARSKKAQQTAVQFMVIFMSSTGMLGTADTGIDTDNKPEIEDSENVGEYSADLLKDMILFGVGIPSFWLFIASFHNWAKKFWQKKSSLRAERKGIVREGADTTDDITYERKCANDPEFRKKEEMKEFMTEQEQDRLGGVHDYIVTRVSGITTMKWAITQFFGCALFHCLMSIPETVCVCVLGKSSRIMTLNRVPMMTGNEAASFFQKVGIMVILETECALVYLRSAERAYLTAMKHGKDVTAAGPIAEYVENKVTYVTLGAHVAIWILNYFWLKSRLRPWGYNDERNYYESKEACVGQYYRTGVRGAIPCLSKRRRKGGMRMFFGPYPSGPLFGHLAAGYHTVDNMEPLVALPREGRDPYPISGSGTPLSPEESAGVAQVFLAVLNVVLGTFGSCVFFFHIYNMLTNVHNCPLGAVVKPCYNKVDCTGIAKSPWFQYHLTHNKLRTDDEIMVDQMQPAVSLGLVQDWLGMQLNTTRQVQEQIKNISETACAFRYKELMEGPEEEITSPRADTMSKFHATTYWENVKQYKYNITWDPVGMDCKGCPETSVLYYFSNAENVVEIIEVLMLGLMAYIAVKVAQMGMDAIHNCPMIDVPFETEPGAKTDVNIHELEKQCLDMIALAFNFRYEYSGVPEHIGKLERHIQRGAEEDPKMRSDPWEYTDKAKSWEEYRLSPEKNARKMLVHRELLGILKGEEVVASWSEQPRLTRNQLIWIWGGLLFFCIGPLGFAIYNKQPRCIIEAIITSILHYCAVEYFILRRRPQGGYVMTTRRIFQITRRPAYKDIFGKVEPLIKMDILIHDCGIFYMTMTMQAYVPLYKRLVAKIVKLQFFRQGMVIAQGTKGIFRIKRVIGDTREVFYYISKCVFMSQLDTLEPQFGEELVAKEKAQKELELPDPSCSYCCCPKTPVPPATNEVLLERYTKRLKSEKDVYGRKMAIRPSTCKELCCGRGCNLECSCCCCCRLDELLSDFMISTHRILVEQRSVQRYCRFCSCCRSTPNIRVTWLAHDKTSAYLAERPARPFGMSKLRVDLCMKLLAQGSREYSAGLMLHQQPYLVLNKGDFPPVDKLWVGHVSLMFDYLTQKNEYGVEDDSSDDASDELGRYDDDSELEELFTSDEYGKKMSLDGIGNKGKKGKGKGKKGKGKDGKGKDGKGKDGKGKDGKGKNGKGKGKGKDGKGKKGNKGKDGKGEDGKGEDGKGTGDNVQDGAAGEEGAGDPQHQYHDWTDYEHWGEDLAYWIKEEEDLVEDRWAHWDTVGILTGEASVPTGHHVGGQAAASGSASGGAAPATDGNTADAGADVAEADPAAVEGAEGADGAALAAATGKGASKGKAKGTAAKGKGAGAAKGAKGKGADDTKGAPDAAKGKDAKGKSKGKDKNKDGKGKGN